MLEKYKEYLKEEEKSRATISKYIRDIKKLLDYAGGREITKRLVLDYKEDLRINKKYKLSSINSFLIAVNRFLEYMGWYGMRVKTYNIQREGFAPAGRDLSMQEYRKLVYAAKYKGKKRLAMVIQTICSTGIRICELSNITVDSVKQGIVDIYCKRKQRKVLLPKKLKNMLVKYIKENNINDGIVFCTSSGKALDRSNIWREMKALGGEANIVNEKVFPHNLRHLFAKTFYKIDKDIAKLADLLGHSSIETTRGYIMTTYEEHQKQLDSMELV
jgi:site-specific recombinase XerD